MTEDGPVRDAGYDDWLDALADGGGYYLASPDGGASLPPRTVSPGADAGLEALSEEPLPETGTVETFTVVHVAPPDLAGDAPYVTAVASFGPVRLTGFLRGVEPDDDAIDLGTTVTVGVEETETTGRRVVAFRPA